MNIRYLPSKTNLELEYGNLEIILGVECGNYFFTGRNGKYYIVSDFNPLLELVEKEKQNLLSPVIAEYEFSSTDECMKFIYSNFIKDTGPLGSLSIPEILLQEWSDPCLAMAR